MIKEYKNGDAIYCPWCNCELDGTAEENVIPNRIGNASMATDRCWECDESFTAYRKDKETVCVTTPEDYEDANEKTSQV